MTNSVVVYSWRDSVIACRTVSCAPDIGRFGMSIPPTPTPSSAGWSGDGNVLCVAFEPALGDVVLQCGVNHVIAHDMSYGRLLRSTVARIPHESGGIVQTFASIAWVPPGDKDENSSVCALDAIVGTSGGDLYRFSLKKRHGTKRRAPRKSRRSTTFHGMKRVDSRQTSSVGVTNGADNRMVDSSGSAPQNLSAWNEQLERADVEEDSVRCIMTEVIKGAHTSPVVQLVTIWGSSSLNSSDVAALVSGGSDGSISVWSPVLERVRQIDLRTHLYPRGLDNNGSSTNSGNGIEFDVDVSKEIELCSLSVHGALPVLRIDKNDGIADVAESDGVAESGPKKERTLDTFQLDEQSESALRQAKLLVGTRAGKLFELRLSDGANLDAQRPNAESDVPLFASHNRQLGETRGLATHPTKPCVFVTVGDDATLRVWDAERCAQTASVLLPGPSRACAFSPSGSFIVVGIGNGGNDASAQSDVVDDDDGPQSIATEGRLMFFNFESLDVVAEHSDATGWIRVVKFSPDGKWVAAGSDDGTVYFYSGENVDDHGTKRFVRTTKFSKHSTGVTALDFSEDGEVVRSESAYGEREIARRNGRTEASFELLFNDVISGNQIPSADALRSRDWDTAQCTLEWYSQGAWANNALENTVTSTDRSFDRSLQLATNEFGGIELARHPWRHRFDARRVYSVHAGHISCARFSCDDKWVFSTGGKDCCVMQWRVDRHLVMVSNQDAAVGDEGDDDDLLTQTQDENYAVCLPQKQLSEAIRETLRSQPWDQDLVAPTTLDEENDLVHSLQSVVRHNHTVPPCIHAHLEFVYGYRGKGLRGNLGCTEQGNVVFSAGGIGIVYDKLSNSQVHFTHHEHDITCLAMDERGELVVTGDSGGGGEGGFNANDRSSGARGISGVHDRLDRGQIRLWHAATCMPLCVFPSVYGGAPIISLAFSSDGLKVASVADDAGHTVCVWSDAFGDRTWLRPRLIASGSNGVPRHRSLFVHFTASSTTREDSSYTLVSGGVNHVIFWYLDGSKDLVPKHGVFGTVLSKQPVLCAACFAGSIVTGTVSGELIVWEQHAAQYAVTAHARSANTLAVIPSRTFGSSIAAGGGAVAAAATRRRRAAGGRAIRNGSDVATESANNTLLVSAGRDGIVKVWNDGFDLIQSFDIGAKAVPRPLDSDLRSVAVDPSGLKIMVGTISGEIYDIVRASGSVTLVCEGHSAESVRGLAPHPTDASIFATAGDDATLRLWDVQQRKLRKRLPLECSSRCVAWSPDGSMIALGFGGRARPTEDEERREGSYVVVSPSTLEALHEGKSSLKPITDLKFSPDGSMLALASLDGTVYVHSVHDRFAIRNRFRGENNCHGIMHLDFSCDGRFMQVNTNGFRRIAVALPQCEAIHAVEARDAKWHEETCPLSWSTAGVLLDDMHRTARTAAVHVSIPRPAADTGELSFGSESHRFIAAVDASSTLHLFGHPFPHSGVSKNERCALVSARAHVGGGANVRFSCDGRHLFTTGERDQCVIQWRVLTTPMGSGGARLFDMPLHVSVDGAPADERLGPKAYAF